jgi:hypothetical protein
MCETLLTLPPPDGGELGFKVTSLEAFKIRESTNIGRWATVNNPVQMHVDAADDAARIAPQLAENCFATDRSLEVPVNWAFPTRPKTVTPGTHPVKTAPNLVPP